MGAVDERLTGLLTSRCVDRVIISAFDGEERLQYALSKLTRWILSAVVCHEPVNEGVRSRLNGNAAEWPVEEVWVVVNALLEPLRTETRQNTKIEVRLGIRHTSLHGIEVLPLRHLQKIIVATDIKVTLRPKIGLTILLFIKITARW